VIVVRWTLLPVWLVLMPRIVTAQSEVVLKEYFEGRTVVPKLAMPGTDDGVDVFPGSARPLDYSRYASRLKQYGTAIKAGEAVIVTKIKVKSRHVEFQLGGGGYGTFGDETSSNVSTAAAPKTKREKNLEAEIQRETDPAKKRAMREELDDLKAAREREDARNRSTVAEAEEHRKENIRQSRVESGSRFNIRYTDVVPADAMTPSGIMAALAQYVSFGDLDVGGGEPAASARPSSPATPGTLHKGMLVQDVDQALGAPLNTVERTEGSLRVVQRKYSSPLGQVTAEFVEGVLIRYTVTSD
jgi:hypothetical protein